MPGYAHTAGVTKICVPFGQAGSLSVCLTHTHYPRWSLDVSLLPLYSSEVQYNKKDLNLSVIYFIYNYLMLRNTIVLFGKRRESLCRSLFPTDGVTEFVPDSIHIHLWQTEVLESRVHPQMIPYDEHDRQGAQ